VKSKQEALDAYRALKLRDSWLAEMLGGYAHSLSLSGRQEEAAATLAEALQVANELKAPAILAQTRRFEATRLLHRGDEAGALRLAQEAVAMAARSADRSLQLQAEAQVAILQAASAPASAARLADLAQQAERLGLRALAIECEIHRAAALARSGDRAAARREIERTLAKAEPLSVRLLLARAHYVRGDVLQEADPTESRREFAAAARLLCEIQSEEGNGAVLTRADLAPLHQELGRRVARP
jgi:hypothetical protein